MMDETFINALSAKLEKPSTFLVDGREYLTLPPDWTAQVRPLPTAEALKVGTLTGLLDYMQHEPVAKSVVHIESPTVVSVKGPIEEEVVDYRRQTYVIATTALIQTTPFPFGQYLDYERFFVGVQTGFVPTDEREQLLKFIAGVRESKVTEVVDDRVSQHVNVQQGLSFVGDAAVPSPLELRPYRTFHEIEQPASPFIVRLQSAKQEGLRPMATIIESDASRWKLAAILAIAEFLKAHTHLDAADLHVIA